MVTAGLWLLGAGVALALYAYAGYPAALWLAGRLVRRRPAPGPLGEWPTVTVTVPVYNEEHNVAEVLDRILESDYPAERLQVLVVSDASTDRTDEIVRGYAGRGVELVRQEVRRGKTAAENASSGYARGAIVVNTDASVRIHRNAIRRLVEAFADPAVGVASGRDVSVTRVSREQNVGESGYVGYEMWVRRFETRLSGIVGASGCLFANRADLHRTAVPEALSRDFAAPLIAREAGYRSVSVDAALCYVPRTASLRREYRRKVRTMIRGIQTLVHKRSLLNPLRYGAFAWMLWSHKVCRWLVPWASVAALAGLALVATGVPAARWLLLGAAAVSALALTGWLWPRGAAPPRALALPAFAVAANVAALHATLKALGGSGSAMWEPTRR